MQKRRIFQEESDEWPNESEVESIDMGDTGDISQGIASTTREIVKSRAIGVQDIHVDYINL